MSKVIANYLAHMKVKKWHSSYHWEHNHQSLHEALKLYNDVQIVALNQAYKSYYHQLNNQGY